MQKNKCVEKFISENRNYIINLRNHFHMNPELAFEEFNTAEYIKKELDSFGIGYETNGATAVLAKIGTARPVIALRSDMDALAAVEMNEVFYKSKIYGKMHACGHDGHMAALLAAAKYFSIYGSDDKTIKFIFQPAEENVSGAKKLIESNGDFFKDINAIFAIHLWNSMKRGQISVKKGAQMAACDYFRITVCGKSCHASLPQLGVDSIYIGAQIVSALQGLISRMVSPADSAVISICSFTANSAGNIIAKQADMKGTMRTFETRTRELLMEKLEAIVKETARFYGGEAEIIFEDSTPAVVNDEKITDYAAKCIAEQFGANILSDCDRTTGGEDFAYYLKFIPGCFAFVGSGYEGCHPHHHEMFDIDEGSILDAAALLIRFALGYPER